MTDIKELTEKIKKFVNERDWESATKTSADPLCILADNSTIIKTSRCQTGEDFKIFPGNI